MQFNDTFKSLPSEDKEIPLIPSGVEHGHQFIYKFFLKNIPALPEDWTFTRSFRTHCDISATWFKTEIALRRNENERVVFNQFIFERGDLYKDVIVKALCEIMFHDSTNSFERLFRTGGGDCITMRSGDVQKVDIHSIMDENNGNELPEFLHVDLKIIVKECQIFYIENGFSTFRLTTNHFYATSPVVNNQLLAEGTLISIKFSFNYMHTLTQVWSLVRDLITEEETSQTRWRLEMLIENSEGRECGYVKFRRTDLQKFGVIVGFKLKFSKGEHSYPISITHVFRYIILNEIHEPLLTWPNENLHILEGNLQVEAKILISLENTDFPAAPNNEVRVV